LFYIKFGPFFCVLHHFAFLFARLLTIFTSQKPLFFSAKNPFLRQFLPQKVVISSVLGESKVTLHGAKSST